MTDRTPARRHRWLRVTVFAGALLLAVGLCIIVHLMGVGSRLDAIRAAGLPVTPAELDAWYTIPPDVDNAADLYARAATFYVEDLDVPGIGYRDLPGPDQPIPDAMRKQIAAHLAKSGPALKRLHEAAAVEHCRHPARLSDGFDALLPYLGHLRTGARLLTLEALMAAEDGRPADTCRALLAALAAARSLRNEPLLVSQQVRLAIEGTAITGLHRILARTALRAEGLRRLETALLHAEAPGALHRAVVGDRCLDLDFLNTRKDFWTSLCLTAPQEPGRSVVESRLVRTWYQPHHLDVMERYVAFARLPFRKRLRRAHEFVGARCCGPAHFDTHPDWLAATLSTLRNFLRSPDHYIVEEADAVARLRIARAALGVERHRSATGRLPAALCDLVPETLPRIPEDPFTGGPLKYKALPNGFAVYSVGIDRADDGGDGGLARFGKDIVFAVERQASVAPATAPAEASTR